MAADVLDVVVNAIRIVNAYNLRELIADVHGFLHELLTGQLSFRDFPILQPNFFFSILLITFDMIPFIISAGSLMIPISEPPMLVISS